MKTNIIAGIISLMFILSLLGGAWSITYVPTRDGFSPSDFVEPSFSQEGVSLDSIPFYNATTHASPGLPLNFSSIGPIYVDYGGVIRISPENTGTRNLFLISVAFEWIGTPQRFEKEVHKEIAPSTTVDIGVLAIEGPLVSGHIQYRMSIKVLQMRAGTWYKLVSGDEDWIPYDPGTLTVLPLVDDNDYQYETNYYRYFDKANALITPGSPSVSSHTIQAMQFLKNSSDSRYNIDKLCAVFEYVSKIITYRLEPEDTDIWQSPEDCLSTKHGDCEDFSLLISAMVMELGGTPRLYLIEGHAFAAIYIGNTTSDFDNATDSIVTYYDTNLIIHTISDPEGYWIIADPLGSLYLGGLPVGAAPTDTNTPADWTFDETPVVYAVDITGFVPETPLWQNMTFWLSLIIAFGISLIAILALTSSAEKKGAAIVCELCGENIIDTPLSCPSCNDNYHTECYARLSTCPKCHSMILPPPPPF